MTRRRATARPTRQPTFEYLECRRLLTGADTLGSAIHTSLIRGTPSDFSGTLADPAAVDLYQLAMTVGEQLTAHADVSSIGSTLSSYLRVFSSVGTELAFGGSFGDADASYAALTSGTYYVGVSDSSNFSYDPNVSNSGMGSTSGPYHLQLLVTPPVSDANGDLAHASSVGFIRGAATSASGQIAYPRDADLFKLSLNKGDFADFGVSALAIGSPLESRVRLFDASGNQLDTASTTGGDPSLSYHATSTGIYYVGISGSGNTSYDPHSARSGIDSSIGSFNLQVTVNQSTPVTTEVEPNNLLDDANSIALGTSVSGQIGAVGDRDFYELTLPSGGRLTATATADGGGALAGRLSLYGADRRLLLSADALAHAAGATIEQHLPAGTYWLAVSSAAATGAAATGSYHLDMSFVASTQPFADLPIGFDAVSIAAGDFNGDGVQDLVTANLIGGDLSFMLGLGDGTFRPAQSISAGSGPIAVVVGHFNQDHFLDLAVANQSSGDVSILLGNGDGTFMPAVSYAVGGSPAAIVAGDFRNSGNFDLAVATADSGGGPGSVVILSGVGDGTFTVGSSIAVGVAPSAIVAGRFGTDAHFDLAVANRNADQSGATLGPGTVSILRGDGLGGFQGTAEYAVGDQPTSIAIGRVNADSSLDLAVANAGSDDVSLLLGAANGSFQAERRVDLRADGPVQNAGDFRSSVLLGDFNGDGSLDLALTNSLDSRVLLAMGDGHGGFGAAQSIAVTGTPEALVAANFRDTSRLDFATANGFSSTVSVRLNLGDGAFQTRQGPAVGDTPSALVAADFNHDGQSDLAVANAASGSLLLGQGNGQYQAQSIFTTGTPVAVASADFNGDGRPDLVTANSTGANISVQFGLGDGTFAPAVHYAVGSFPDAIAIGDFNGDGRPDIAVANFVSNTVSVLLNIGGGVFAAQQQFAVGQGPRGIAIGDFNADGRMDLAVANSTSNNVSLLLGAGNGTFGAQTTFAVGADPRGIAVGEFNGDNRLDLAVVNAGSNNISILLNQASGGFSSQLQFSTGTEPRSIVAGDFNGDHRLDLATPNAGDNTVSVLLATGAGTFSAPVDFSVGQSPTALVVIDSNHDGRLDLATSNGGDRSISTLLGQGDGTFLTPDQFAAGGQDSTPTLADVTGDGIADSIVLDRAGKILVRPGRAAQPGAYDAARIANPVDPARAFTVVDGPSGKRIAAVDLADNFVSIYSVGPTGIATLASQVAVGVQPARIVSADLNGDGRGDLVVANAGDATVSILLATPNGLFAAQSALDATSHPAELALVDLTGSGHRDILLTDPVAGTVTVLMHGPGASFTGAIHYRASTGPAGFSLDANGNPLLDSRDGVGAFAWADFNGDGALDLVVGNPGDASVSLLAGDGAGGFLAPRKILSGIRAADIQAGHIFPGGKWDLAILDRTTHSIDVLRGDGAGNFSIGGTYDAGNFPNGLLVGDFNRDGRGDLVVGNEFGDVMALTGVATGAFDPFTRVGQRVAIAVGSLSANGQQSWLVTDQTRDRIVLQVGGSTPGFLQDRSAGIVAPGAAKLTDLNGDGIDDLIVANSGGNDVLVYLGLGGGKFAAPKAFYSGVNPVDVQVADVNGDGRPDVVVTNQGSNDVSVFFYDSTSLLRPGPRLNVGLAPVQTQIGDFQGTGHQQLLVTNSGSNSVSLLPALGGGFFNDVSPLTFNTGSSPQAALVGHFFGGAGLDLVTLNYQSNTLTVYADMNGSRRQDISSGGTGPLSGVVGDFLQSGGTELVIGNNGNGAISVFVGGPNGLVETDSFFDAGALHPTALALAGGAEGQDLRLLVADEGDESVRVFSRDDVAPSTALVGTEFSASGGVSIFALRLGSSVLFASLFSLIEQFGEASPTADKSDGMNAGGAGHDQSSLLASVEQVSSFVAGGIHWLQSALHDAAKSVGLPHLPEDLLDTVESALQVATPGVPWRVLNSLLDGVLKNVDQAKQGLGNHHAVDRVLQSIDWLFGDNVGGSDDLNSQTDAKPPEADDSGNEAPVAPSATIAMSVDELWEDVAMNGVLDSRHAVVYDRSTRIIPTSNRADRFPTGNINNRLNEISLAGEFSRATRSPSISRQASASVALAVVLPSVFAVAGGAGSTFDSRRSSKVLRRRR